MPRSLWPPLTLAALVLCVVALGQVGISAEEMAAATTGVLDPLVRFGWPILMVVAWYRWFRTRQLSPGRSARSAAPDRCCGWVRRAPSCVSRLVSSSS